ncbi:MAG: T9SS type A sorting domain-containing protein [Flavobacteriales bacterium]|nr:T9SS type A sorting domain-containing protein [Flavobacteriales bacterium]
MKTLFTIILGLVALSCIAQVSDQQQLTFNSSTGGDRYQSFTPGMTGQLVEFWVNCANSATSNVYVYDGQGTGGTLLRTELAVSITSGGYAINFVSPINMTSGNEYTVRLESCDAWQIQIGGDPYAGGVSSVGASDDYAFETFMNTCTVVLLETSPNCNGGTDGDISLTASGGTNYTYMWSNAGETTQNISGLSAGSYSVTMIADGACTVTESVTISDPTIPALSITSSYNDATGCSGSTNGDANVSVSGGLTAYTYLWNDNSTTLNISGLGAGTYTVTTTDACGSEISESVTISDPSAITVSIAGNDVSCNGLSDGDATASLTGGSSTTFTYVWNNGATDVMLTGLGVDTLGVTVTDGNACSASAAATITDPSALAITISGSDPTCTGGATDGDATAIVTGGPSTAYSYMWDNSTTDATQTGLMGGTYSVTVSSGTCSVIDSVMLNAAVVVNTNVIASICDGEVLFVGGANQDTSGTFIDTYVLSNGCDSNIITIVTWIALPSIGATTSESFICEGISVDLNANGPNNATYVWDNASALDDNTIEEPVATPTSGTTVFTVTVTKNSCSSVSSVSVDAVARPILNISENISTSTCTDTITITSTATSYFWTSSLGSLVTNSNTTVVALSNSLQVYMVVGTDDNGCSSDTATINLNAVASCAPIGIEEVTTINFELYPNPNNGSFSIEFGKEEINQIKVIDVTGKVVYQDLVTTQTSTIELVVTSGVYFVEVTNNDNVTIKKVVVK